MLSGRAAMRAMEQTMTMEHAFRALRHLGHKGLEENPLFAALLQKEAGHHHRHRRALRGHRRAFSGTAPNTATPAPDSGVASAAIMLNEMIMEAENKLDLEEVRCSEFES